MLSCVPTACWMSAVAAVETVTSVPFGESFFCGPPCACKRDHAHICATSFVTQMQLGCPGSTGLPPSPGGSLPTNGQQLKDRSSRSGVDPRARTGQWLSVSDFHATRSRGMDLGGSFADKSTPFLSRVGYHDVIPIHIQHILPAPINLNKFLS